MPRLMSVSLTEIQVRARAKTVTRRAGWLMLKPGDQITLCRKVMGRRKGEPLERITTVEVVSVRREPLSAITVPEVVAEGFPDWTPAEFVAFFCRTHKGIQPDSDVTRIEWRYISTCGICGAENVPVVRTARFGDWSPVMQCEDIDACWDRRAASENHSAPAGAIQEDEYHAAGQ